MKKDSLIDQITATQASEVLRSLWNSDSEIRKKIEAVIKEQLSDVDYNEVCSEVGLALNSLNVDEVYDHSGRRRDGYHDPGEVAIEMLENVCHEYEEQMKRYHQLQMYEAEKEFCKGVLLSLYEFEDNADEDFIAQAPEMAGETFKFILDDWKKRCHNKNYIKEM
ncbi:MAG: hypothetical protein LJE87_09240, partial [Deltaproteobacteria bacterium]|nr:hypothetical protein [Deltaproteobacteria bacterium]